MKPTDNLHQLVKSLTSSEKRYFKIFSTRHVVGARNKYEILFDIYDSLPDDSYDEAELKAKLKKKQMGKNLADDKRNLQEMIMRSMLSYTSGQSVDTQLNDLLAEEDFYRQKRLNDLRRKTILKAKEIARTYEKYPVLLTLIEREVNMKIEMNQGELAELADNLDTEKEEVLRRINIISALKSMNQWFFIHFRLNPNNIKNDFWLRANQHLDSAAIKDYTTGYSYNADINYYKIWALYYQMKRDFVKYNEYTRYIYNCYEKLYPLQKEQDRVLYKKALYNYLSSLFQIRDYSAMGELLHFATTLTAINEDEEGEDFQNIAFYRQMYYMNTNQFTEAIKMVDEINQGLKKYNKKVNKARELAMYSNITVSFMMLHKWDDVLTYTERIVSDPTDVRMDLKHQSMIRQLIAYYETDNIDLLNYAIRNIERLLKKRHACGETEAALLKALHHLTKYGKHYFKSHADEAHSVMEALKTREELMIWFQSQLTGKYKVAISTS